ncbi:MAG: hypothetical protein JW791_05410 [Nanoarchaeota archaeon]|nr:hypothetical protein [Nanoarchaeota archaeon]
MSVQSDVLDKVLEQRFKGRITDIKGFIQYFKQEVENDPVMDLNTALGSLLIYADSLVNKYQPSSPAPAPTPVIVQPSAPIITSAPVKIDYTDLIDFLKKATSRTSDSEFSLDNVSFYDIYEGLGSVTYDDIKNCLTPEMKSLEDEIQQAFTSADKSLDFDLRRIRNKVYSNITKHVTRILTDNNLEEYEYLRDAFNEQIALIKEYITLLEKDDFKNYEEFEGDRFNPKKPNGIIEKELATAFKKIDNIEQKLDNLAQGSGRRSAGTNRTVSSTGASMMILPQRVIVNGNLKPRDNLSYFFQNGDQVLREDHVGKVVPEFLIQGQLNPGEVLETLTYNSSLQIDNITLMFDKKHEVEISTQSIIDHLTSLKSKPPQELQDILSIDKDHESKTHGNYFNTPIIKLKYSLDMLVNDLFPVFNAIFDEAVNNNTFSIAQAFHYIGALIMPNRASDVKCSKNDTYAGSFALDENLLNYIRSNHNLPQTPQQVTPRDATKTFKHGWLDDLARDKVDRQRKEVFEAYKALYLLKKLQDNSDADFTTGNFSISADVTMNP